MYPALKFDPGRLSPEEKMLLLCSRTSVSGEEAAEIGDLASSGIDWGAFAELASGYKVAQLSYGHLQIFQEDMPVDVRTDLRNLAGAVLARNTRDTANIRELSFLFAARGIDVIFTKGAAFLADVYGAPGFRDFSDIDILVRESDMPVVEEALKTSAFKEAHDNSGFPRYRSQKVFLRSDGLVLDVHVDLIGRRLHNRAIKIDMEKIWREKRQAEIGGAKIFVLDLLHDLAYQCLHLSMNHSFSGLRWYVDINEFLRKHSGEFDWDGFLSLVKEYRIKRPVYYSLFFAEKMLGAPVPARIFDQLGKSKKKYDNWVFERIRCNQRGTDYLAELAMFDSMGEMMKFAMMNFAVNPRLAGHFVRVLGRAVREAVQVSRGTVSP
jgi:nitrogen regulatory protein PII